MATPNSVCCVHCVRSGSVAVVERCGKYDRVATAGAQFVCWRASSLAQRRSSPPSGSIAAVHARKHDAAVKALLGSLKFANLHAKLMLWPPYRAAFESMPATLSTRVTQLDVETRTKTHDNVTLLLKTSVQYHVLNEVVRCARSLIMLLRSLDVQAHALFIILSP